MRSILIVTESLAVCGVTVGYQQANHVLYHHIARHLAHGGCKRQRVICVAIRDKTQGVRPGITDHTRRGFRLEYQGERLRTRNCANVGYELVGCSTGRREDLYGWRWW